MKQNQIRVGESYLFHHTLIEHRLNMVGQVVTVVGKKKKAPKKNKLLAKRPIVFTLSNGQTANASELNDLKSMKPDIELENEIGGYRDAYFWNY